MRWFQRISCGRPAWCKGTEMLNIHMAGLAILADRICERSKSLKNSSWRPLGTTMIKTVNFCTWFKRPACCYWWLFTSHAAAEVGLQQLKSRYWDMTEDDSSRQVLSYGVGSVAISSQKVRHCQSSICICALPQSLFLLLYNMLDLPIASRVIWWNLLVNSVGLAELGKLWRRKLRTIVQDEHSWNTMATHEAQ